MELSRSSAHGVETLPRHRGKKRKRPMFSTDVERALCYRWRDHHDIFAAHQLARKYLHLASEIAEGYGGCGISLEELIGEAYVGLMRAVCRFDPDCGECFTTYATWHVRESIHDYMVRTMRMPLLQIAIFSAPQDVQCYLAEIGDVHVSI